MVFRSIKVDASFRPHNTSRITYGHMRISVLCIRRIYDMCMKNI